MKTILISFLCLFASTVHAQRGKLFTPSHGLSNTSFYSMTQDKDGLVWIATENGLNKFDGFSFTSYFSNPSDTNSLSSNFISSLFVDSNNRLWIGTNDHLYYYNKEKDNFSVFHLSYRNREFTPEITSFSEDAHKNLWITGSLGLIRIDLQSNQIYYCNINDGNYLSFNRDLYNASVVDNHGNVWVGTDEHGVLMFSKTSGHYQNFCKVGDQVLCNGSILALGKDPNGNILIGTLNEGVLKYIQKESGFRKIPISSQSDNFLDGAIYSIASDKNGTMWIGTERNGMKVIKRNIDELQDANELISGINIRDNKVHCYPDKDGNIWLCIDYVGVYLKHLNQRQFFGINKLNSSPLHINHDIVKSIYYDRSNNLWIGTDGGGLNKLNLTTKETRVFKNIHQDARSIPDNAVIAISADKDDNLWIGTYLGGLSFYDRQKQSFRSYLINPSNRNRSLNYVTTLAHDSIDNLWVGTNGGGLWYFDKKQQKFYQKQNFFLNRRRIQTPPFITTFLISKDKTLWIGGYSGLFAINETSGQYRALTKGNSTIMDETILALHEDKASNIWFGTRNGLYKFDPRTNEIKAYFTENGLSHNSISGILEDKHGNLWISTLNGINKMTIDKETFSNYSFYDGLPGNEFRPSACFEASNGNFYFGSTTGVVYFNPDSIRESEAKPHLMLTKLRLFNEEVKVGQKIGHRIILSKPINYSDEITLSYSDNSFTIEFAAINYVAPEKIRYEYMMEGFDQKFITKDYTQRYATYTNLNPGTYTFLLKNTNIDGVWDNTYKKLIIHVKPPFWKTWWAYCIYTILLLVILFVTRRLTLYRISMENKLEMEKLEREKLEELNQSKLDFFSNVSHEFRTPLTLILGPLERLKDAGLDKIWKNQVEMVYRNAQRLLRLVNLLLDLQKVEKNEMHLKARKGDIVSFIREITMSFEELAHQKKISLFFTCGKEHHDVWFDPDKMDKVLFNLLSNAFKFTSKGGSVTVDIQMIENSLYSEPLRNYVKITVSDTGIGMKEEYLQKIFDRFYQIDEDETEIQLGSGIGLHLSKYLVSLHQGQIQVSSKEGEGSRFEVLLPAGSAHLKPEQKITEPIVHAASLNVEVSTILPTENTGEGKPLNGKNGKKYKVLIVEDNFDVRDYIKTEIQDQYEVMEASDGKEGLAMVHKTQPDLIISDVMMPNMDGIQFCKKIKTDIQTSHIPVILLTARTSMENRIEGLETGADSYIPKPFHPKHLQTRIEKLIELRQNLIHKFSKTVSFEAKEMTLTSADERFLQKAMNLVKDNISNPDLNIEDMGTELGMSRVHLYRKLKAMTNQTPSEFVRTIRLKQSAYLLGQNKLNISEVAYAVGFSSHQYFTNCFQNYFGMSPTEYCQKAREESMESQVHGNGK